MKYKKYINPTKKIKCGEKLTIKAAIIHHKIYFLKNKKFKKSGNNE